ncbi:MAG: QueG-associated DUF1730 domain-containing protein, partial [Bacteroidota bacterium]
MPGFDLAAQRRTARALKDEAHRLGFDACGIAEAVRLDDEARQLEAWLTQGRHGSMRWMENHFEKRVDPRELVPGARSVISLLANYYQPVEPPRELELQGRSGDEARGKISRYAWGEDYHVVLKEKLYALYNWLNERCGGISGRAFVDSAPVL